MGSIGGVIGEIVVEPQRRIGLPGLSSVLDWGLGHARVRSPSSGLGLLLLDGREGTEALPAYCFSSPRIPNWCVFLLTPSKILLWMDLALFLGLMVVLWGEEQGETSLSHLVWTISPNYVFKYYF